MKKQSKLNKNRLLFTLLVTQAISIIGTRMTGIAIGIWIFQRTGQAMDLLLIPFFSEMPQLLFGHYLGALIDRFRRKVVLIVSDLGQALGTWILILLIITGWFEVWHLYIIVFLQGVFSAIQVPAVDATITMLTDEVNRSRVNGIKELLFPTASIVAPVVAGIIYVQLGIQGVVAIDLISFLIGSFVVAFMRFPEIIPAQEETVRESVKVGMAYLLKKKALIYLILYVAMINFLLNGPLELVIPYILSLTGDEMILSVMMSVMSGAAFAGGLLVTVFGFPKHEKRFIVLIMSLTGFSMLAFGIARDGFWLGVFLTTCMMPLPALNAVFRTVLQSTVPSELQGRVLSIAYQVAYGLAPISFLIAGPVVDRILEPMMLGSELGALTALFGNRPGSGMGLMISAAGVMIVIVTWTYSVVKPSNPK